MKSISLIVTCRVVDPKLFVSDPDLTFKEVSAPTPDPIPDPDPVSDPATLVSASRKLRGILMIL